MAAGEDVTVADLTRQLKQAFEEISLGANYPMPTFNGKKGENPEDHCMKAEDYSKGYKIVRDEDKRRHFTVTLFLTARRWAEQLPDTVTRKVQLQDKNITTDIRQKFEELCEEYGEAFSKNNEDISRTKLIKMDIDTGDSPLVSSRPYTLPLKHYEWVQGR